MGPDRRETILHHESMEQNPNCQISLSAAISDNTSTVKPGVHVCEHNPCLSPQAFYEEAQTPSQASWETVPRQCSHQHLTLL